MQLNQGVTVSNQNNKRSSMRRMTAPSTHQHTSTPGVGGRQANPPSPGRGGGYLDTCTGPGFEEGGAGGNFDPRLKELEEISGLSDKWKKIARAIGFDAFIRMWMVLDEDNIQNLPGSCERVRIWVPSYRSYLRFQRNRYIMAKAADGAPPEQVRDDVKKIIGESLSLTHIQRIMSRVNITE